LLIGDTNGNIQIYLNINTNSEPLLAKGIFIQANGTDISVGERAAPVADDWNGDGKKDLVIGNMDGNIVIYLNKGTDEVPVFDSPYLLQIDGEIFDPGSRTAPRIFDWNGDGLKDILVGEVEGYVYYLKNVGTNNMPLFKKSEKLFLKNGDILRYPGSGAPRSRVFVTDWNNDGLYDIVLGGMDGRLVLYLADQEPSYSPAVFVKRLLVQSKDRLISLKKSAKGNIRELRRRFLSG
jgi:hypothetical protein